jgi:hypothetical protein
MVQNPGHDFSKLSILHDHELMLNLKQLVTTEPTPGIMTVATGIPPHIELASQVQKILDITTNLLQSFGAQTNDIIKAVKNSIEEKAWDSGHVTGSRLAEMLENFQKESMKTVNERLGEIRTEFSRAMGRAGGSANNANENAVITAATTTNSTHPTNTFAYEGRFHAVPRNFEFPKVKLREAIRFWLCGQSVSEDGKQRVKPFKNLTLDMLPNKELKNAYKLQWKPIFAFVSEAANFPTHNNITTEEINQAYDRIIEHLKSTVSYCFLKNKSPQDNWTIATWSVRVSRSSIEKNGTQSDKEKLGDASNRNKPRGSGKRNRKESNNPLYFHRQKKRKAAKENNVTTMTARAANNNNNRNQQPNALSNHRRSMSRGSSSYRNNDAATTTRNNNISRNSRLSNNTQNESAFARAFGHVTMTATMEQRDREISNMVREEMAEEAKEQQQERAREGDAVANDGTVLFMRRTNQLPSNNGDNSTISRSRYRESLATLAGAASTPCPIPGCKWSHQVPAHKCYNSHHCKNKVHCLCAQSTGLSDDDNELNVFCSLACKQQKQNS